MNKKISIGRERTCDIFTGDGYSDVSRHHADIFLDGSRLVLEDHSTNGTYVNGQKIHHTRMEIRVGDTILFGRHCPLSWVDVTGFFPEIRQNDYGRPTERNVERHTERYNALADRYNDRNGRHYHDNHGQPSQRELDEFFSKWNWGAFFLNWIWGIVHKVYWTLIIFIPCIGSVAMLVGIFILGANGNKWAWNSRQWESLDECKRVQRQWRNWGLGIFIGSMVLSLICYIIIIAMYL